MSLLRRDVLLGSAGLVLSALGSSGSAIAAESLPESTALAALATSPLIYVSPIVSRRRQSRCHAEVWFVHRHDEIFVVTWADKWKAKAIKRGFRRAKIWIGDFGPWKSAEARYLSAPSLEIKGRFESDPGVHSALLADFASKYKSEWRFWDQRVRDGLSNGAWVLLRYQIIS